MVLSFCMNCHNWKHATVWFNLQVNNSISQKLKLPFQFGGIVWWIKLVAMKYVALFLLSFFKLKYASNKAFNVAE